MERVVKNMARCTAKDGCMSASHDLSFDSHEERANWVGAHRVKTGHAVRMWLEPR